MATLYAPGTEFLASEVTMERGTVEDIVSVGVYFTADPEEIPDVADFTIVSLVDGNAEPLDPRATPGRVDIIALVGPRGGDVVLTEGTYQLWTLITTATEDVVRRPGTVEVIG